MANQPIVVVIGDSTTFTAAEKEQVRRVGAELRRRLAEPPNVDTTFTWPDP